MSQPSRATLASRADKHVLYQQAVQDPETEVARFARMYRNLRGDSARRLREDFCGTGLLSATWAESRSDRRATGLDIDSRVLEWGWRNNVAPLGEKASRVQLLERDVLRPTRAKFDLIVALNYSYFTFHTRKQLRAYFRAARSSLANGGVFVLDAYGGSEAQETGESPRRQKGFVYVWDQASFNPIDQRVTNHIHFRFRDGSEIRRAFTYHWRLWHLAEIRELLQEAGFESVDVYWEDEDSDGDATGVFRRRTRAENCPCWNAYIVAYDAVRSPNRSAKLAG